MVRGTGLTYGENGASYAGDPRAEGLCVAGDGGDDAACAVGDFLEDG